MPLLAIASNGARLEAWMMSSAEWEALKADYRTRSLAAHCCGSAVVPVTSQTGWQFFRHKGAACSVRESPHHLIAKTVVARAAAALGLDVTTEARLNDGAATADVLIRHLSWAVAVEVQLSRIPLIAIEDRQERYGTAGVRCAWLVGYDVPGHHPRQDLPLFRLVRPNRTRKKAVLRWAVVILCADTECGRRGDDAGLGRTQRGSVQLREL